MSPIDIATNPDLPSLAEEVAPTRTLFGDIDAALERAAANRPMPLRVIIQVTNRR